MSDQKKSKFGLGLFLGTVIGGITALFLAPKSGKELRKDVAEKIAQLEKILKEKELDKKAKKAVLELSEEAKVFYQEAKKKLIEELAHLKKTISEINWQDYQKAVAKVLKQLKKEGKKQAKEIEKIRKNLLQEWKKMKKVKKSK